MYMIKHDVDEACYLGDRLALMTNGPGARVAEVLVNPLPLQRTRNQLHMLPGYYPVRNHLVEFLVSRSELENKNVAVAGYPIEVRLPVQV